MNYNFFLVNRFMRYSRKKVLIMKPNISPHLNPIDLIVKNCKYLGKTWKYVRMIHTSYEIFHSIFITFELNGFLKVNICVIFSFAATAVK